MGHQEDGVFGVRARQPDEDILHRPAQDKPGMIDSHPEGFLHLWLQAKGVNLTQKIVAHVGVRPRNAHWVGVPGDDGQALHGPCC